MTYSPGDPGHIQAHVDLVTAVNTEAERFGLADDLPLRGVGDEGHLDDHNAIRAKLELIETTAGRTFGTPLPPVRNLGDPGHVDDHTALLACALEASLWPAWNDATGGYDEYTVNNYNGTGEKWRVIEFLSSGTLTVTKAAQPFRVLVVAGGGGGSNRQDQDAGQNWHSGNRGGGAEVITQDATLTVAAHTVTVGNGGGNMSAGQPSSLGAISARAGLPGNGGIYPSVGGASGNGNAGGSSGTFSGGGGGAGGPGASTASGPGVASDITGATVEYGKGQWADAPGDGGRGGPHVPTTAGKKGIVVVAYRIG